MNSKSHLLIGPVGAGKQTNIDVWLSHLSQFGRRGVQVSTGNIIASNIADKTRLGMLASPFYRSGNLVPDEITFQMLSAYFESLTGVTDYIYDGFPRTVFQYEKLLAFTQEMQAPLASVVALYIPDEVAIDRLTTGRVVCAEGHSYHLIYNPPPESGLCACGKPLEARIDDVIEKIRKRLQIFHTQTEPILDLLQVPLLRINANQPISQVGIELVDLLDAVLQ